MTITSNVAYSKQTGNSPVHKGVYLNEDGSVNLSKLEFFSPGANPSKDIEDALDSIKEAVNKAGYKWGEDIKIALDCASSEFYKDGKYNYTTTAASKLGKPNPKSFEVIHVS